LVGRQCQEREVRATVVVMITPLDKAQQQGLEIRVLSPALRRAQGDNSQWTRSDTSFRSIGVLPKPLEFYDGSTEETSILRGVREAAQTAMKVAVDKATGAAQRSLDCYFKTGPGAIPLLVCPGHKPSDASLIAVASHAALMPILKDAGLVVGGDKKTVKICVSLLQENQPLPVSEYRPPVASLASSVWSTPASVTDKTGVEMTAILREYALDPLLAGREQARHLQQQITGKEEVMNQLAVMIANKKAWPAWFDTTVVGALKRAWNARAKFLKTTRIAELEDATERLAKLEVCVANVTRSSRSRSRSRSLALALAPALSLSLNNC
jgi:hypothetical protein